MPMILLADDNSATRSALKLMFSTRLGLNDIQEVTDWNDLLAIIAQQASLSSPAGESRVNPSEQRTTVILLDWELPGLPAHESLAYLQTLLPSCKIIALSARLEARREALQAGANAFIAKSDPPERVIEIICGLVENHS